MRYGMILLVLSALAIASPAFAAEESRALTLRDCYTLALEQSETLGIQKERIKETEGQMLQALSTALPKVAFVYSQEWKDQQDHRTFGGSESGAAFTFTQPLFTGFKEFAAIRGSKHVGKQRKAELKRAMQLLFTDVSDAFFLYMSLQENEALLQDTRKALYERLAELKKRELIGRSRLSEVASAESKLQTNEAALEVARSARDVAGRLVEFLIGRPFDQLIDEGDPQMNMTEEEAYRKVDHRPDVEAASESLEAYKQNVTVARSGFFPSVSLGGNSYAKRPDANEGNDWDVMLSVNVPIFNGTYDVGQVQQAKAQMREAELQLSYVRRSGLMEVKNDFARWQANGRQVAAFDKAVMASEKNYRLQVADFEKNLVNNLDVLQALEDLQNVRQSLVAAKAVERRSYWALKVATGDVSP
jgi:outer membrane protein